MKLILINWLPATWKTSLWKIISEKLKIPFYSKDSFKEIIFDSIWGKKELWREKIAQASYDFLYFIIEQNMKTNTTIIAESNFDSHFSTRVFKKFQEKYSFEIIQIKCFTSWKINFERFKERAFSKQRHIWHDDKENIEKWKGILTKADFDIMDIWWDLLEINTTDFDKINYSEIYNLITK